MLLSNIFQDQVSRPLDNGALYRGSYMSAHGLLTLLNALGKKIKCESCRAFYLFFTVS